MRQITVTEGSSVTLLRVQRWGKDEYPNMRELEYWLDGYEDLCNNDPVLELFAELFPALSSLKPYGEMDCLKIGDFKELRRLDLTESIILDLKKKRIIGRTHN